MRVVLWVLQIVLAVVFVAHGWILLAPPESVVEQLNATLPRWFQVFLGVAEVAAAIGLTLPGLTRVKPGLVPLAAGGIITVMIAATVWHLVRSEFSSAAMTFILMVMAIVVGYQRWRVMPIEPRLWSGRETVSDPT